MAVQNLKRKPARLKHGRKPAIRRPAMVKGRDAVALFDKVALEVLRGHRALFDSLSLSEQQLVIKWLSDAMVDGPYNAIHDVLWEIDYHRKPVDIETFITDDHYLGKICKDLHPLWVDDLKTVFAPQSKIFEWIMTGAIGIGKTTLAMVALAYRLHCFSCLRDPPAYYGLLPQSLIIFGIYSITKRQVADTGYFKLRGYVDTSPYFQREFPRSNHIDSQIDFEKTTGKKLKVIPGSRELHALGLDLFSFSMDEVNFMREKTDKERGMIVGQAYDLYNATRTRIATRFIRPGGMIPGIMLLMSSRQAQTAFLERHLKQVQGAESTHVSDYAIWETKAKTKFTKPRFKVEVGDRLSASRVLAKGDVPRKGSKVIEVPGEFRPDFAEDVDEALRNIAGVATFNVSPFIRDRASIYDAIRDGIPNPFTRNEIVLDVMDDVQLAEFFQMKLVCRVHQGRWVPRINPAAPRFGHTDLSLSGDCAGIAMGHVSGITQTERTMDDGTVSQEPKVFIILDFMLRIRPPSSSEIDLSKIRAFWFYIHKFFPLRRVTFDGFQSADSMQLINKAKKPNLEAGLVSVDKTSMPYDSLRSAHFDRRIAMYRYNPYIDEVLDLERHVLLSNKIKVDHPIKATQGGRGSKDVSDAGAGVVWTCVTDERATIAAPFLADDPINTVLMNRVVDPATTPPEKSGAAKKRHADGRGMDWENLRGNVRT